MHRILKQSVVFLDWLEKESFLLKHYHYLIQSNKKENEPIHLRELNNAVQAATQELSKINRRETCKDPFWTESHKVTAVVDHFYDSYDNVNVTSYNFHTYFSYNGKAPIARIELDTGHQFDYLKTWWDPELSENREYIQGGGWNLLRLQGLMTLGIYEATVLGCSAFFTRCQFTEMNLQGETSTLNCMKYWEKDITLPEQIEAKHKQFTVEYKGRGSGMADCYYREPKVTIYTSICYMHGNPERIESLKSSIALLETQRQEVTFECKTDSSLELVRSNIRCYAGKVQQYSEEMSLIATVFTQLPAYRLHNDIKKFIQIFKEREQKISADHYPPVTLLLEKTDENSAYKIGDTHSSAFLPVRSTNTHRTTSGIMAGESHLNTDARLKKQYLGTFKNSVGTLFHRNYQFSLKHTERKLTIEMTTSKNTHPELFNKTKENFEQLAQLYSRTSLKKESDVCWTLEGEETSLDAIKQELQSINEGNVNSCRIS